ncbi:MAG: M50 family metallopeptidase [Phycisphaerales bacterium]
MTEAGSHRAADRAVTGAILIVATAMLFWLLFMAVHELGHAIGAWCSGGKVVRVVLSPLAISRTDVSPNPHPLFVVWCGPLIGVVIPALFATVAYYTQLPLARWLRAFTGFCLIANGLYLASGVIRPAGDTQDMIWLGTPEWLFAAVGLVLTLVGFLVWHAMGSLWGLRTAAATQLRRWACWSVVAAAVVSGAMLVSQLI